MLRLANLVSGLTMLLSVSALASPEGQPARYSAPSSMEPFLFPNPADEVALARSAAPASVSDDAEVWTLSRRGYVTAFPGKNGFVCFVDRSWSKPFDDPEFWSPKVRAPQCANAAAARSMLPIVRERAVWVMAGLSKREIAKRTQAKLATKALPTPEVGNIVYMMSKAGFISEGGEPHWHPHIMFYLPVKTLPSWGENHMGAPIIKTDDAATGISTYFILVPEWSDGTAAEMDMMH